MTAGIVVLLAVCLLGGVVLIGWVLGRTVDAPVTMLTPGRPPDWVYDQHADDKSRCGVSIETYRLDAATIPISSCDFCHIRVIGS